MTTSIDWWPIVLGLIGGLALFLYALNELAGTLSAGSGDGLSRWMARGAQRPVQGFLGGTGATVALDSSSATIVVLIGFVQAGVLTAAQALPVVLGANLGTAVSSQLMAAGLDDFAPLLFAGALLARALLRGDAARRWMHVAAMIALLLFGLNLMGDSVKPLAVAPETKSWLAPLSSPLVGVAIGAGLTALLQSSSATMGLVLALATGGVIPLPIALAIMLGAEIGTCVDALIAAVGRGAAAIRVGVFHLGYNLVSVAIGLAGLAYLTAFAQWSATGTAGQIANAHLAFNLVGGVVGLAVLGLLTALKPAARRHLALAPDRSYLAPAGRAPLTAVQP